MDCDDADCSDFPECLALCDVAGHDVGCHDADPCTTDECVAGECVFSPYTGPCDDGNANTVNDVCDAGLCLGTWVQQPACTPTEIVEIWPTSGHAGTLVTAWGCGFGTWDYSTGERRRVQIGGSYNAYPNSYEDQAVTALVFPWMTTDHVELMGHNGSYYTIAASPDVFTVEPRTDHAYNAASEDNGATITYESVYSSSGTSPWNEGYFLNASNSSTWTQSEFDGTWAIDELWAGHGRDDTVFVSYGCAQFELQDMGGTWTTVATTCGQPLVLEAGWQVTIDPPMEATAVRYSQTGHGWFIVGDLRAMGESL